MGDGKWWMVASEKGDIVSGGDRPSHEDFIAGKGGRCEGEGAPRVYCIYRSGSRPKDKSESEEIVSFSQVIYNSCVMRSFVLFKCSS